MGETPFLEEAARGKTGEGKMEKGAGKFEDEITSYREELMAYARRFLGKSTTSRLTEDVVQAAFVKALENRDKINRKYLRTWLYTVVRNEALTIFRKESRRQRAPEKELEGIGVEHDPGLDLHREQVRVKLQAAIQALSPEHAEAIALFMSGCHGAEAARQMGINYNAYKSRLFRAQGRLRELLIEAGVGLTEV